MNKTELVKKVASQTGQPRNEILYYLDCIVEEIYAGLEEDGFVQLTSFGTWRLKLRNQREGRNPKTGKKIQVPTRFVPKFKPGKILRDLTNAIPVQ